MKFYYSQKGESQALALVLLAIVMMIIVYLLWSGEMGTSAHTFSEVFKGH
jgi:hypothetical protein